MRIESLDFKKIEKVIFAIRGQRVMLDADLAKLYGVPTKRLNEQVKRNRARFPSDFMFQLNEKESSEVVANCDHLDKLKFSHSLPFAFTEHGAVMLAAILNSASAVQVSVQIVRAFVYLRQIVAMNKDLALKLEQLEKKIEKHDGEIQAIFTAIRQLMKPPESIQRKIGFNQ